jgi:hypothetical protein
MAVLSVQTEATRLSDGTTVAASPCSMAASTLVDFQAILIPRRRWLECVLEPIGRGFG